jgi:hypothetical protein
MSKTQYDIPSEVDKDGKRKDKFDLADLVIVDDYLHINYDNVAEQIEVILKNTRRVSKQQHSSSDLKFALDIIDAINNLNEFQHSFDGYRLDEIFIPKFLQDFVAPSRVALKDDSRYPDLRLINPKGVSDLRYNPYRMKRLNDNINGEFRTNVSPICISDLRKAVKLDDIHPGVHVGGSVLTIDEGDSKGFVPILLKDIAADIFGTNILNEDANVMFNKYLLNFQIVNE